MEDLKKLQLNSTADIEKILIDCGDEKYKLFTAKLNPVVDPDSIIGVRVPQLRSIAKAIVRSNLADEFTARLPHRFFEENHLHAFVLTEEKNVDVLLKKTERFLPYIDNWAVCDSFNPKAFSKDRPLLKKRIVSWLNSSEIYTIRFGVNNAMRFFLGDDFDASLAEKIADIKSDEYYVKMVVAWYFATALAKSWDEALPFVEKLDPWTRKKTIQKSRESFRVTDEHKSFLLNLKT